MCINFSLRTTELLRPFDLNTKRKVSPSTAIEH